MGTHCPPCHFRAVANKLHADPEFAAKNAERMRKLNADPEFNPLAALTQEERADYDVLVKKGGLSRHDALVSIGRSDLVLKDAAE